MTGAAAHTVTLRAARAADVPAVYRLLHELAEATGLPHKFASCEDDLLRHGFGATPLFEVLLAADESEVPIGLSLFFYTYSSWRGEPGVYVQDLVVSRKARAKGVGLRLLCATARHARTRGATHLRLSVEQDNTPAIGFYEHAGLRLCDNERLFEASDLAFDRLAAES